MKELTLLLLRISCNFKIDLGKKIMLICFVCSFVGVNKKSFGNEKRRIVEKYKGEEINPTSEGIGLFFQQTKMVTGKVTDENAMPIPGVNIKIEGTTIGTTTDFDGYYEIEVANDQKLIFSFIGYEDQSVTVEENSKIDVTMKEGSLLDEVVIVGYGTQKKIDVTGSISTVEEDAIKHKPTTNLTQALTGTAPGVTVIQRSSRPGANDESIRIRGVGTWGDSNPLVLVDGIEQSLNSVNPNDVESVTVLKDAAAAAIYGSRAGNGVVLVTTKSGEQNEEPVISYSTKVGIQVPTRKPNFKTTYDHYYIENLSLQGRGSAPIRDDEEMNNFKAGIFDPDKNMANTNWVNEVLRSAIQQDHNVTINAGGKTTSYYVSLGYLNQESVVGNQSSYDKYNARINTRTTVSNRLKINSSLAYMDGASKEPMGPYGSGVLDVMHDALRTPPYYPIKYSDGTWSLPPAVHNPVRVGMSSDYGRRKQSESVLNGRLEPEFEILDGLKIKGLISVGKSISKIDELTKSVNYLEFTPVDGTKPSQNAGGGISRNAKAENWSSNFNYTLNTILNYRKKINNHSFDVLLGTSKESFVFEYTNSKQYELPSNDLDAIGAGTSSPEISGTKTEAGILSYFGRLNYNYDDRYIAEMNVRRDGSSKFAQKQRWGTFPSFSLAWNVGRETFFNSAFDFFNSFKVRASYGLLGNNRIGDYQYFPIISANNGTGYSFGNNKVSQAYYEASMGNEFITWERMYSTNFGLDFETLNNRLRFSLDVYERKTKDILLGLPAPGTLGISPPTQNVGSVRNRGWEIDVGWSDKVGDFSYSIIGNLSDVKNKILDLKNYRPVTSELTIRKEGAPVDAIYGYVSDGIVRPEDPKRDLIGPMIDYYGGNAESDDIVGTRFGNGDIAFKDLNNDGKIDENDKKIIGNQIPRYTYSLTLNTAYKNFDLSLFFQGVGKVDGYLLHEARDALFLPDNVYTSDNVNARYPRPGSYETSGDYNSFWVEDASYLRLKNISIGYELSKPPLHINSFRIFVAGSNIFTLTKFSGFDPETPVGRRGWGYPITSVFSLGLDITF